MSDIDINEAQEIMELIVSAAAKQTVGAQRIRAAADTTDKVTSGSNMQDNNASAVGRLHNAARRARAILPEVVVAELEAAAGDA